MPSNDVRLNHVIDAPPAAVWAVLTDIDRAAETLSGVSRVELAVFGRLAMRMTAKVMKQDLADIAARAEAAR